LHSLSLEDLEDPPFWLFVIGLYEAKTFAGTFLRNRFAHIAAKKNELAKLEIS
jgi:hypothetical protein